MSLTQPAGTKTPSSNVAPDAKPRGNSRTLAWRLLPLAAIVLVAVLVFAMGWHRALTLETLVRHRAAISAFVADQFITAVAAYVGLYIVTVALSLPGGAILTVAGGILFGTLVGGVAAVIGATIGSLIVFLIAQTAIGTFLTRGAGPLMTRVAEGFREDAFNYLLFLRLVPAFPFWLVNLAPALFGVPLVTFVVATVLGIIPATFTFASVGTGVSSAIAAQETAFNACLASGRTDCQLDFDLKTALTPELLAAFVALGVIALLPVVIRRLRARKQNMRS